MFIKSAVSDAFINTQQICRVEVQSSDDDKLNPCFDVVAYMRFKGIILYRAYAKEQAVEYMNNLFRKLTDQK